MQRVKWLLFDLGGVLLHVEQSRIFEQLAERTGRSASEVKALLAGAQPFWDEFIVQEFSPAELSRQVAKTLNVTLSDDEVVAAFNSELGAPIESTLRLLPQLRSRVSTGCLSNTNSIHWDHMLRSYEMMQHFDRRFASQILGYAKPAPEIYTKVVEQLGVAPQQILFFDDKGENVRAASELGWNARVYRDHAGLLADLHAFELLG